MAVKTTLERLEQVQAAIAATEQAQRYTMGQDVEVLKAKLEVLYAQESKLLAAYNRQQRSGGMIRLDLSSGR